MDLISPGPTSPTRKKKFMLPHLNSENGFWQAYNAFKPKEDEETSEVNKEDIEAVSQLGTPNG
jgi:hypothetical protein